MQKYNPLTTARSSTDGNDLEGNIRLDDSAQGGQPDQKKGGFMSFFQKQ